jgi:hypothetical protein
MVRLRWPDLASGWVDDVAALLNVGFNQQDAGKIRGGNYVRVFCVSLG